MPELPEVETVVRGLRLSLPGRTRCRSALRQNGLRGGLRGDCGTPSRNADFGRHAPGEIYMYRARGRAAQQVTPLSQVYLIIHLGMTGQLTVIPFRRIRCAAHAWLFCSRRWPRAALHGHPPLWPHASRPGIGAWRNSRDNLGKEPLEISAEEFCRYFGSRRARVKALLLDQRVLRGIGNIYADESLFRARLHPARIAENLTKKQLLALHGAVRQVLAEAIRSRGSSISDYVDSERQSRRIPAPAPGLPARWEAVLSLQGKNHARMIVAGRSSHFCPQLPARPAEPQGLEGEH